MIGWLFAFAWVWFVLGLLSGAVLGLGFHRADFMGGYDSWRRRLARLGHISFFGTGGLALAMALSASALDFTPQRVWFPGVLVMVGAITMPTCCFLSAWRRPLRHGFVVPVVALVSSIVWFTVLVVGAVFE